MTLQMFWLESHKFLSALYLYISCNWSMKPFDAAVGGVVEVQAVLSLAVAKHV